MRYRSLTPLFVIAFAIGFSSALQAQITGSQTDDYSGGLSHRTASASVVDPGHDDEHSTNREHAHDEDHAGIEAHHCEHCNEHEHGHDHHHFDYLRHFHHRHETAGRYPMFEMLRTDHAFIERKVRADFVHSANADGGEVNETEFEFEVFWAVNSRIAWFVEAPVILLDPVADPSTSGIGDLEAGFRFVAFDGEYDIVTFGLNVSTPTGDSDRNLGAGHTNLEPVFLWWHDIGCGWVLQSEVA
jgi:hypothetical protein